jgi:hypothetical protein
MDLDADCVIRAAAFTFPDERRAGHDDALPWSALHAGFILAGARVPLIAQQGIFKLAILDLPLSNRTAAPEEGKPPCEDGMGPAESAPIDEQEQDLRRNYLTRVTLKTASP